MKELMIQGNTYDLELIDCLITTTSIDMTQEETEVYKQFNKDVYKTYVQIRNVHKPKACMKYSLEKVKANLRNHWLEIYLDMNRKEAELVIEYAELFFGLAIK
ncbi:hypothetical protein COD67_22790 [Bacillus cereus]|nr:hypothetical protein COI89_02050 [Bacillus cereus]PGU62649.1 hypothetical protein COD67_22790 [Bacillus cereus]